MLIRVAENVHELCKDLNESFIIIMFINIINIMVFIIMIAMKIFMFFAQI